MNKDKLTKVEKLIREKKIDVAQNELSRMGQDYNKNAKYLYLRGKVFYLKKLYWGKKGIKKYHLGMSFMKIGSPGDARMGTI